ncbi:hypothetical protein ACIP86_04990 [Pseudomonas neuropathica]
MRWLIFSVAVAISFMVAGCGAVAPKVEGGKAGMSGGAVADAGTKPLVDELAASGLTLDDLFAQIFFKAIGPMKAKLPEKLNDDVELYDVSGSGRQFTYWVRLLKGDAADFDTLKVYKYAKSTMATICTQPQMLRVMKLGGTYRYNYVGRDKMPVTSVVMSADDCTDS